MPSLTCPAIAIGVSGRLGEPEQIVADLLHGLQFAAAHGDGAECEERTCQHLGITELTADLDGTTEHAVCLGIGLPLDRHQQPAERDQQFGFEQVSIRAIRHASRKLQSSLQVISGLGQASVFGGMFTGQPVIGRGLGDQSRLGAMMSNTAGSYGADAAVGLGSGDDRSVDLGPPVAGQTLIGHVAYERVLERVQCLEADAALKRKTGCDKFAQSLCEQCLRQVGDGGQQCVGEVPADHRAESARPASRPAADRAAP